MTNASAGATRTLTALDPAVVSHTFTIPALGIDVPIAAQTRVTLRSTPAHPASTLGAATTPVAPPHGLGHGDGRQARLHGGRAHHRLSGANSLRGRAISISERAGRRVEMVAAKDTGRLSTEMAGLVQLNLTLAATVDLERVAPTFGSPEAPWLGERAPDGPHGIRRFSCDLELRVSPERRELFRKAAIVGLGEPRHDDATWIVPIEWFAATFAPLF